MDEEDKTEKETDAENSNAVDKQEE